MRTAASSASDRLEHLENPKSASAENAELRTR
jgi:hypothetical protein